MSKINKNEFKYAAEYIDVNHYNRNRAIAVNLSTLSNYPLYDVYVDYQKEKNMKRKKKLLDYAVEFYGEPCVKSFFARCFKLINKG